MVYRSRHEKSSRVVADLVSQPTMEDVARRAKVSRALVSLVINGSPQVSDERRRAVLLAAEELGYRPNLLARRLAQQRTHTIGVLVDDLRNPFFGEVVDGIEAAATDLGLQILILNGHRDQQREIAAVETFLQFRVEGLALVGSRIEDGDLARFGAISPCVVVASGNTPPSVDAVVVDDRHGAQLAVQHLVALGHQRITHIDGAANVSAAERRAGYRSGMQAAGLDSCIDVRRGGDNEADALAVIDSLLAEPHPPTAIFAFNDLLAAGALDRLTDSGVTVPADMSLVGFDNTFISALRYFSLTTINQPMLAMGRLAVDTLLHRISNGANEPVRHTLQPELVVRGTTGAPRGEGKPMNHTGRSQP